jgi:ribosomal protein S18 acetylase RimI-like enzyme
VAPPQAGAQPAELARLYVDHAWQGRGVAAALLDAVSARAAAAGATGLWLAVYQRNARAVAFYRRQRFVVAGAGTFRMGDELQHDWVMMR